MSDTTDREQYFERVAAAYETFQQTGVIEYPEWLHDPPKSELMRRVQGLSFGETAELEFGTGQKAFLSVDV